MKIIFQIEQPNHERNGSLLLRLQINKICMAIVTRWVGFEWVRLPSAWVVSAGFFQAWNEHGI